MDKLTKIAVGLIFLLFVLFFIAIVSIWVKTNNIQKNMNNIIYTNIIYNNYYNSEPPKKLIIGNYYLVWDNYTNIYLSSVDMYCDNARNTNKFLRKLTSIITNVPYFEEITWDNYEEIKIQPILK